MSWVLTLFVEEKRLLMETFCRDGDRRIELGDSPDEDDEEATGEQGDEG